MTVSAVSVGGNSKVRVDWSKVRWISLNQAWRGRRDATDVDIGKRKSKLKQIVLPMVLVFLT